MTIIQENSIVVANLDKKQYVVLVGTPIVLASSNHLPVDKRGKKHDTKARVSTEMVKEHQTMTGFFALMNPRSELHELLAVENLKHGSRYGSWYGDRLITYGVTQQRYSSNYAGSNPLNSNTNKFTEINKQTLLEMGIDILTHLQIMAE